MTLDTALSWVDEIDALDVDPNVRADVRVAWQWSKQLELSLTGQNLLERHEEYGAPETSFLAKKIPRTFFAAATRRY
jgi:hypothetical protein